MTAAPRVAPRRWAPVALVLAAAAAALAWFDPLHLRQVTAPPAGLATPAAAEPPAPPADPDVVELPAASWEGAGLEIAAAARGPLVEPIRLTGKIMLNEDRLAHIHPLVEGRIDKVLVRFGDHVKAGQVLVIVESTQVGDAKLELFQDRQRLAFATQRQAWQTEIATNVRRLITAIRTGESFEAIERDFKNLPMGDAREKLIESYAAVYKSNRDLERLRPLSAGGVIASKQLLDAETAHTGDEATLQALLEQSEQDLRQSLLVSRQAVEEARTRVAVGEKHLAILGLPAEVIAAVDADTREQSLAQYEITAPFDGTVIGKDVVLQERVGPEKQILSIADLATVWVSADIFEKHLPLVERLQDTTVAVRADAWPDREFQARIFYTGDIIEEESRTIALRAVAENPDRLLKPGMFVTVAFPGVERADVLQLPKTALFEHEGRSFVFVHEGGDRFRRHHVTTGESTPGAVEIVSGIAPGDRVAVAGGFALKSRLLAGLLEGE